MDLKLQVKQYIRKHQLIEPGDTLLVGLSGGADSVGLLRLLCELRGELDCTVTAVHVNHGIRGREADRDERFCEDLCRTLEIPMGIFHEDVPAEAKAAGLSWEEAGRNLRREIFRREADRLAADGAGRVRIALAHHMDDQAETVLMNLIRGSGIRGLAAMEACTGDVIRPLLGIRREEIREYLRKLGQDWCEDSTNQDTRITRNRIRRQILPELEQEVNARTVEHLAAMAEQAGELDGWIEQQADDWIEGHVTRKPDLSFPAEAMRSIPGPLRRRILQRLIADAAGHSRDLTARHLEAVEDLAVREAGGTLDLPYGLRAQRVGDRLRIGRTSAEPQILLAGPDPEGIPIRLPEVGEKVQRIPAEEAGGRSLQLTLRCLVPGDKIPEKEYTKWFDYDKIQDNLRVRTRRAGDTLAMAGVGHKPLRRFMLDAHIPAEVRDRVPVLADERGVLWVIGFRMSADYQVTGDTKRILEITCEWN